VWVEQQLCNIETGAIEGTGLSSIPYAEEFAKRERCTALKRLCKTIYFSGYHGVRTIQSFETLVSVHFLTVDVVPTVFLSVHH